MTIIYSFHGIFYYDFQKFSVRAIFISTCQKYGSLKNFKVKFREFIEVLMENMNSIVQALRSNSLLFGESITLPWVERLVLGGIDSEKAHRNSMLVRIDELINILSSQKSQNSQKMFVYFYGFSYVTWMFCRNFGCRLLEFSKIYQKNLPASVDAACTKSIFLRAGHLVIRHFTSGHDELKISDGKKTQRLNSRKHAK